MTANAFEFTLGTSGASQIVPPNPTPRGVTVENLDGSNAVWIGGSSVAANAGYKLLHGVVQPFTLAPGDSLYAIADAGSPILSILVTGE